MQRPCLDCGALIAEGSRCRSCGWRAHAAASPDRMRGRKWMRRRAAVIRRSGGMCELCQQEIAAEVHHVDGDRTNNTYGNLQALCAPCHLTVEAKKRAVG